MATEVNQKRLLTLVKGGNSLPEAAEQLGLPVSVVGPHFYRAEVEANPKLKAPATPKSVKNLRDNENLRWERIAARTGMSVSAVKTAYEDAGGSLDDSWTGRGRKPGNGNGAPASRKTADTKKTGSTRRGRKTATATATRRRGRPRKTASATPARARTRAQRARKSGNPS